MVFFIRIEFARETMRTILIYTLAAISSLFLISCVQLTDCQGGQDDVNRKNKGIEAAMQEQQKRIDVERQQHQAATEELYITARESLQSKIDEQAARKAKIEEKQKELLNKNHNSATHDPVIDKTKNKMQVDLNEVCEGSTVKYRCGYSNTGHKIITCALIAPEASSAKQLHALQEMGLNIANHFRNKYQVDFWLQVSATKNGNEVPISNFIYSVQFDQLDTQYMWR
jgi:hypothetical protein